MYVGTCRPPCAVPSSASAWNDAASGSRGYFSCSRCMAPAYAESRDSLLPAPYSTSTVPIQSRSRSVGAFAARARGSAPRRASAARAAALSCSIQMGWLYAIASPQYAMAKPGSTRCASRNACSAAGYSKLCISATPRMNCACAAAPAEVGKSTSPSPCVAAPDPCACSPCASAGTAASARASGAIRMRMQVFMAGPSEGEEGGVEQTA